MLEMKKHEKIDLLSTAKQCPFCGSNDLWIMDATLKQVECTDCGAAGPMDITYVIAVKKWNEPKFAQRNLIDVDKLTIAQRKMRQ